MEHLFFVCTCFNHELSLVQRMVNSVVQAMLYRPEFKYSFMIVDNSDVKGSYEQLETYGKVLLINDYFNTSFNPEIHIGTATNCGYCKGNNLGCFEAPNNSYIIIINPDIIITSSLCIDWMVGSAKLNNSISGWMIGTNEWYTYASSFPTETKYDVETLPFFPNEPTLDKPGKWKSFKYIDGSLMCFSKKTFDIIDGFDINVFPGYFGENVFCFKAFLNGIKLDNVHTKQYYKHEHGQRSPAVEHLIYSWSKIGRQYFYENYALPNWDRFIQYLNT